MRILLVGNYALDNQASMLRYANMLCSQMAARGHQVEIVRPRPVLAWLSANMWLRKWLGYLDKYLLFPFTLRARAPGFDLVHICDHSNSMYLRHVASCPASIACHDLLAISSARGDYPGRRVSITGRLQQHWILRNLAAANSVVCVSANTARELAAFPGPPERRVVVVPNAIEPSCAPAAEADVQALRERLGLGTGERYLLHVGGALWYKNRLGALRIFKLLCDILGGNGVDLPRLVMAGDPLEEKTRRFVASNLPAHSVIELPSLPDKDLWALYSGATALLFPSLHEGFGWPLIEAQRCGCPVITSQRAPMNEVAGDAALYIEPENESGAAQLIASRLESLRLLREAGLRNARRFDPEVVMPAYEEFFAAAARTRRCSDGSPARPQGAAKPRGLGD
jgi:glycosyltransferase involved in cell wall biosynthesis